MCRTSLALDCQLCKHPGCTMVCGTAAMEAITSISKATATQFQMQRSTNCSMPLPFPTIGEAARLRHAYNMANTWGYPSVPALQALVRKMGVGMKDIKGWFAEERKAQGHAGNGSTTPIEKPPAVEVRARLPVVARGSRPSASYVPKHKGEYMEDGMKSVVDPLWPEASGSSITLYAYDSKDQEPAKFAILDASALYDNGDVESKDSGFEHASTTEVDIKEHGIGKPEEPRLTARGPNFNELPSPH